MKEIEGLTVEKLKTFLGFENLPDDEAETLCEQLRLYASILLRVYPPEKMKREVKRSNENENDSNKKKRKAA